MAFHDVLFPKGISYGSSGGPGFRTDVIKLDSGYEARIAHWNKPLRRYDARYGVKSYTDLNTLIEFYIARQGAANSFRFHDFMDCSTASASQDVSLGGGTPSESDVQIGVGDGSTKTFQLQKSYSSGSQTATRDLTKPVSGTVLVALDGVKQTTGWSVDLTTGIVSFTSAPGDGVVVTAGCQFDVPCRFGNSIDDLLSVNIESFGSGDVGEIEIVEVRELSNTMDAFNYGGALEVVTDTDDVTLSVSTARVYVIDNAGSQSAILPDTTDMVAGGPVFYIINASASNSLVVKDFGGTTLVTLSAGKAVIALLSVDTNDDLTWYLI